MANLSLNTIIQFYGLTGFKLRYFNIRLICSFTVRVWYGFKVSRPVKVWALWKGKSCCLNKPAQAGFGVAWLDLEQNAHKQEKPAVLTTGFL